MVINKDEIRLVQQYWFSISGDVRFFSSEFHTELFTRYPQYQQYFKSDRKALAERLMQMINIIINGVEVWDQLEPEIEKLGRFHARIADFKQQDYENIVEVLIDVMCLAKPDTDQATIAAWRKIFNFVSETMLRGATALNHEETTG